MTITKGDIFYILPPDASLKSALGYRLNGKPAIVVSNNLNNAHSTIIEVVYLTRREKKSLPTHITVVTKGETTTALCEQIDSVSVNQIGKRIGHIRYNELIELDEALKISLALN